MASGWFFGVKPPARRAWTGLLRFSARAWASDGHMQIVVGTRSL
ncbi:transaldolase [Sulfitobacter sp. NAS-14.1]|nr:transaldolase [Sulfitobacter sp. NAS-14.1]